MNTPSMDFPPEDPYKAGGFPGGTAMAGRSVEKDAVIVP